MLAMSETHYSVVSTEYVQNSLHVLLGRKFPVKKTFLWTKQRKSNAKIKQGQNVTFSRGSALILAPCLTLEQKNSFFKQMCLTSSKFN